MMRTVVTSPGLPMFVVMLASVILLAVTTVIHYEVLSLLNARLPTLGVPSRTKLLAVIFATFIAHMVEMVVYGVALFGLVAYMDVGALTGKLPLTLLNCIYFSAETYTSLGFGDVTPEGHLRLLVGVEALNGLLLIGWSASYAYIAMERFWVPKGARREG